MHASMTALVVVADPMLRAELNKLLGQQNVLVREAASIADAADQLAEQPYELVIVAAEIVAAPGVDLSLIRDVAVLLVGPPEPHLLLESLRAGVDGYLPLPLDAADLGDALAVLARTQAVVAERQQRAYEQGATHERAALLQQVQADSLALVSRLAANLAHEINNPLTPIIGLAELLLDEAEPRTQAYTTAQEILVSARRIAGVVQSLRGFTHPLSHQEQIDLRLLVDETVATMAQRLKDQHIDVQLLLPNEPVLVEASRAELKQALFLLCEHARAAMPHGGTLQIKLDQTHDQQTSQRRAMLAITDTAPPIASYHLPALFEPFYSHGLPGIGGGTGLAVVRRIVELHGGAIEVEPHQASGNTFHVRLPPVEALQNNGARL